MKSKLQDCIKMIMTLLKQRLKIASLLVIFILCHAVLMACPVCQKQQPSITRGLTHGAGPQGSTDYIIVCSIGVIVLVTFFFSLKWLIRPGEQSDKHIKRFIINNN